MADSVFPQLVRNRKRFDEIVRTLAKYIRSRPGGVVSHRDQEEADRVARLPVSMGDRGAHLVGGRVLHVYRDVPHPECATAMKTTIPITASTRLRVSASGERSARSCESVETSH